MGCERRGTDARAGGAGSGNPRVPDAACGAFGHTPPPGARPPSGGTDAAPEYAGQHTATNAKGSGRGAGGTHAAACTTRCPAPKKNGRERASSARATETRGSHTTPTREARWCPTEQFDATLGFPGEGHGERPHRGRRWAQRLAFRNCRTLRETYRVTAGGDIRVRGDVAKLAMLCDALADRKIYACGLAEHQLNDDAVEPAERNQPTIANPTDKVDPLGAWRRSRQLGEGLEGIMGLGSNPRRTSPRSPALSGQTDKREPNRQKRNQPTNANPTDKVEPNGKRR